MPDLLKTSPDNPDFARVLVLARMAKSQELDFDVSPTEDEYRAIAKLFDANSVRKMRMTGTVAPLNGQGWRLTGKLGATVIQPCVVSLEPVTTRVDVPVERKFVPMEAPVDLDYMIPHDLDDSEEPLTDRIDIGLVALEALSLALPTYPKKEGISLEKQNFAEEGVVPIRDEDLKPFAGLAKLRNKLGDGT